MRWCRSQKPAKSAASIFPVATGCHRARAKYNAGYAFWFGVLFPTLRPGREEIRHSRHPMRLVNCGTTACEARFHHKTRAMPQFPGKYRYPWPSLIRQPASRSQNLPRSIIPRRVGSPDLRLRRMSVYHPACSMNWLEMAGCLRLNALIAERFGTEKG